VKQFVESVAILAPGLTGWAAGRAVLAGEKTYQPAPLAPPVADLLPAVERRRTGSTVKFALAVGHEALTSAGRPVDSVATVFVSSGNDGDVINDICVTLAGSDRQVSPTRFHNSVHNAPSGYWGIATHSHHPSTSLCGFDWSFAIGLLEAAAQLQVDRREVLLVAYDTPYPEPLGGMRPVAQPFGAALLFTRDRTSRTIAEIEVTIDARAREISRMSDAALEQLRTGNPCARALPLLAALAGAQPQSVTLERDAGQTLSVSVRTF
jgi:Beta-ketoacyl synthase, N-terminal domain